jgi:hypothetical protein
MLEDMTQAPHKMADFDRMALAPFWTAASRFVVLNNRSRTTTSNRFAHEFILPPPLRFAFPYRRLALCGLAN